MLLTYDEVQNKIKSEFAAIEKDRDEWKLKAEEYIKKSAEQDKVIKALQNKIKIDQTFLDELAQDMRDNGVDDEMFISETIAAMNNYPYDYPYQENKEQCPPIK